MKVLHLLLSIWILFCSGTPCTDLPSHSHGDEEVVHTYGGHEDFDHCSPFCICACCAVTTALTKTEGYYHKQAALPALPDIYICPPVRDYPESCWQPPRQA